MIAVESDIMLGNVLEGPAVVAETATEEDVVRAVGEFISKLSLYI